MRKGMEANGEEKEKNLRGGWTNLKGMKSRNGNGEIEE